MADAPTTTISATPPAPLIDLKDPVGASPIVKTLNPEVSVSAADQNYYAFFRKMKEDVAVSDPLSAAQRTPAAMARIEQENEKFSGDVQRIISDTFTRDMTVAAILEAPKRLVAAQLDWQRTPVKDYTEPKPAAQTFGGPSLDEFIAIPKRPGPSGPDRVALQEEFKAAIAAVGFQQVDPVAVSPAAPRPDAGMVLYDSGKYDFSATPLAVTDAKPSLTSTRQVIAEIAKPAEMVMSYNSGKEFDPRIVPLAISSDASPSIITSDFVMANLANREIQQPKFDASKPAPKSVSLLATLGLALSRLDILGSMQVGAADAKFTDVFPDAVENNSRITRSSATQISAAGAAALELKPPQLIYDPAAQVPEYKRKQPVPVFMMAQGSTH